MRKNVFAPRSLFLIALLVLLVVGCSGVESLPSVNQYRQAPTPLPDPKAIPSAAMVDADPATAEIEWETYPSQLSALVPGDLRVRVFQIVNNDHETERRAFVFYGNGATLYLGQLLPFYDGASVEKIFFNYGSDLNDGFMLGRVDDKIAGPRKVTVVVSKDRNGEQVNRSSEVTLRYFLIPLFIKSGWADNLNWLHQIKVESADGDSVTLFMSPFQIASRFKRF